MTSGPYSGGPRDQSMGAVNRLPEETGAGPRNERLSPELGKGEYWGQRLVRQMDANKHSKTRHSKRRCVAGEWPMTCTHPRVSWGYGTSGSEPVVTRR